MENLLRLQLTNLFVNSGNDTLSWTEILETMQNTFNRGRDETFNALNELINEGRIENPTEAVYCLPGKFTAKTESVLASAAERKAENAAAMSRQEFDRLTHEQRNAFVRKGGVVEAP